MTRETEKCPLSVLPGVRIKRVNLKKIYELFVGTNENVRIKRLAVERGSTVLYLTYLPQCESYFAFLRPTQDNRRNTHLR